MSDVKKQSLRDQILDAVPAASHTSILKMALDKQITDPDDPQWAMVGLAWSATESASISRASLDSVRVETAKIPDHVFQGGVRAGIDLSKTVEAAGKKIMQEAQQQSDAATEKVRQGIAHATKAGSDALRQAIAGLRSAGTKARDEMVAGWRADLAAAARDEVRAGLTSRMARSWGLVSFLLFVAACIGAFVFWLATNSPPPTTCIVGPVRAWQVPGGTEIAVTDGNATSRVGCPAYFTQPGEPGAACWEIVARR